MTSAGPSGMAGNSNSYQGNRIIRLVYQIQFSKHDGHPCKNSQNNHLFTKLPFPFTLVCKTVKYISVPKFRNGTSLKFFIKSKAVQCFLAAH